MRHRAGRLGWYRNKPWARCGARSDNRRAVVGVSWNDVQRSSRVIPAHIGNDRAYDGEGDKNADEYANIGGRRSAAA